MIRIMIISHTFAKQFLWKRWKLLTKLFNDIDVTLIAPVKWTDGTNENYTFGKMIVTNGISYEDDRFHVHLVDMKQMKRFGWISKRLIWEIRHEKPDYIYHIGTHLQDSLFETILITKLFSPKTKIMLFSMRGPQHTLIKKKQSRLLQQLNYLYNKLKLKTARKYAKALFCHYPGAKSLFLKEGFKEPIFIQTQVGVDTSVFFPSEKSRKAIREKYNLGGSYVFGSAIRLSPEKGVLDVISALPIDGNWKYLLMGAGSQEDEIKIWKLIQDRGLMDKVIMTGFIDGSDMPDYWNAVDCAIHVPKTTDTWVETFSLALIQAMATGLCVIGNDSGSVPYQIGPDGIILPEGDITAMQQMMIRVMEDLEWAREIGQKMRKRAVSYFDIVHLTKCFYTAVLSLENHTFDAEHMDAAEMH